MSTLHQLEEKIYSLVPELKELTLGCKVKTLPSYKYFREEEIATYIDTIQGQDCDTYEDYNGILARFDGNLDDNELPDGDYEIIGHEIHPHHWLPLLLDRNAMDGDGNIWKPYSIGLVPCFYKNGGYVHYDPKKSFKDQSPEFHEWLLSQLQS